MGRLAVLGGTFNPIHNGHLHLAKCCAAALGIEKVLLIPTFLPPHKQTHDLASGSDRLEMCRLAGEDDPLFEACDLELKRGGNSYTVDTVQELKKIYPDEEIYLLLGTDMMLTFDHWYRFEEILKNVILCAGAREQEQLPALYEKKRQLQKLGGRCEIVEFQAMPLSSTEIREKIKNGMDVSGLMPDPVLSYIREKGLYRMRKYEQMRTQDWMKLLQKELSGHRFYHTVCVAEKARELAIRVGIDPEKAYLGGLLHDLCKDMSRENQLSLFEKAGEVPEKQLLLQPQLWHGPCAAIRLETEFEMNDPDLLNAVRYHTTGRAEMSTLEKVIFIADAVSKDRDYPGVEEIRKAAEKSLNAAMLLSISGILEELKEKNRPVCTDTAEVYRELTESGAVAN